MSEPTTKSAATERARLLYMYRDAGNWKRHGGIVVSVTASCAVEDAAARLRRACAPDGSFNAAQVGLPDLFFDDGVTNDDHSWHEFVSMESTQAPPTDRRSLLELVEAFERERVRGWWINGDRLTWE